MRGNFKNILIILLIAVLISQSFRISKALVAGITVPVTDYAVLTNDVSEWSLDKALLNTLNAFKKRILDSIVDQTVDWINGNGKPKFVTDWQGFLRKAADDTAGDFVNELGAGFLCQPFSLRIRFALFPVPKFAKQAQCTLDTIVRNIEAFEQDFINGSWIAYSTAWQPQNNFYGSYLLALNEKITRTNAAAQAAQNEAVSGGGFLSIKKCRKDNSGKDITGTCTVTTPGKTIGDSLSKAIGATQDSIIAAEDLSAYIAAISDALLNRIIRAGVDGLRVTASAAVSEIGTISPETKGDPCDAIRVETTTREGERLKENLKKDCQRYNQTFGDTFSFSQTGFIQQIDFTLQPRLNAINEIKQSISIVENYIKSATAIYNELAKISFAICQNPELPNSIPLQKAKIMEDIQQSINEEQNALNLLRQNLAGNQNLTDSLKTARDQISALNQNQWESITGIFNGVSDKIDPTGATNFENSVKTEQEQIITRTNNKLTEFNQQLEVCKKTK